MAKSKLSSSEIYQYCCWGAVAAKQYTSENVNSSRQSRSQAVWWKIAPRHPQKLWGYSKNCYLSFDYVVVAEPNTLHCCPVQFALEEYRCNSNTPLEVIDRVRILAKNGRQRCGTERRKQHCNKNFSKVERLLLECFKASSDSNESIATRLLSGTSPSTEP